MHGNLRKLATTLHDPVQYALPLDDELLPLNECLGQRVRIQFAGEINCVHCGRKIRKSFQQGYCFPCYQRLAACDLCILRPERCHFHAGTCREPDWGLSHCMQPHVVYLANSSGLKVGITRRTQIPTRWIDQGASSALPVFRVESRYQSGLIETVLKQHVSDRTDWRKMLRGNPEPMDLLEQRERLLALAEQDITKVREQVGGEAIKSSDEAQQTELRYPVLSFPAKVKAWNLDKQPDVEGDLLGIKGQYLILDSGVLNVRKYAGYQVSFAVAG